MKLFKHIVIYTCIIFVILSIVYLFLWFKGQYDEKLSILKQNINDDNNLVLNASSKIVSLDKIIGYLTIEKINMYNEEIKEGVDDNILKGSIGHFSNTALYNGNVCLAGHNYKIDTSNLFSNLNKLEVGDNIVYTTKYGKHKYSIYKIYEIKDDDFSILENTKENSITLITCIGNRKDIRLCVKAKEI